MDPIVIDFKALSDDELAHRENELCDLWRQATAERIRREEEDAKVIALLREQLAVNPALNQMVEQARAVVRAAETRPAPPEPAPEEQAT